MANDTALHGKPISEIRRVTCHMGSHSVVTYHMTHVNAPRLNPSQTDRCLINLSLRDERLS